MPLQQNRDPSARPGRLTLAYGDDFSDVSDTSGYFSETRGSPAPSRSHHPSLESFHSLSTSADPDPEMETDPPPSDERISRLEQLVAELSATVHTLSTRLAAAEAKVLTLETPAPAPSAPVSVSTSRPRFPPPPHFDGDREKGRAFIEALQLYASAVTFDDDQQAIAWALSFCSSGHAIFVRRDYLSAHIAWPTWDAFLDYLRLEFLPIGERTRHAVTLQGTEYHQGQRNIDEYIDAFRDICRGAGYNLATVSGAEAEHLVLLFRRGLEVNINDAIALQGATPDVGSLSGWFDAARRVSRAIEENRVFKSTVRTLRTTPAVGFRAHIGPAPASTKPAPTTHVSYTPPTFPPPTFRSALLEPVLPPGEPMDIGRARRSATPGSQTRCYNCNKLGHLSPHCPDKCPEDRIRLLTAEEIDEIVRDSAARDDLRTIEDSGGGNEEEGFPTHRG